MTLDEIIADLKQSTQYGDPSVVDDQAAKNVLSAVNDGISDIVMDWDWDWLMTPVSITLIPGQTDYALSLTISKLLSMDAGAGNDFLIINGKAYFKFYKQSVAGQASGGQVYWGMFIGRNATDQRLIRLGDIPSDNSVITGFGKLKVGDFSNTDLGTAKSMLPFPREGINTLKAFVLASIYRIQAKDALIFPQTQEYLRKVRAWRGGMTDSITDVATGLPPYLRAKKNSRRNGYVV